MSVNVNGMSYAYDMILNCCSTIKAINGTFASSGNHNDIICEMKRVKALSVLKYEITNGDILLI